MTIVLGVPACPGSPDSGEHGEPARLRSEGLLRELASRGVPADDVGDVPGLPPASRPARAPGAMRSAPSVVVAAMRVREAVTAALEEHDGPLVAPGRRLLARGGRPARRARRARRRPRPGLARALRQRQRPRHEPQRRPRRDGPGAAARRGRPGRGRRPRRAVARRRRRCAWWRATSTPASWRCSSAPASARRRSTRSIPRPARCTWRSSAGCSTRRTGRRGRPSSTALRELARRRRVAVVALTGTSPERVSAAGAAELVAAALGRG